MPDFYKEGQAKLTQEETMSTAHIIYTIIYRLSVLAAGFGCVVMGYKLFVMGVMPKEGSTVDANAGNVKLSLKNAAPGTCFAALGVFLMVSMVIQGNPEQKIEEVPTPHGTQRTRTYRSDGQDMGKILAQGKTLELEGKPTEAIMVYTEPLKNGDLPLKLAIAPLRAIASVYQKQDCLREALVYALLAHQVDPKNADGLALIARIHLGLGNKEDAISYIKKAADIDHAYTDDQKRMTALP